MEKKLSDRMKKVLERAMNDFDTIINVYDGLDYVELKGIHCGKIKSIRYYDNGAVEEQ